MQVTYHFLDEDVTIEVPEEWGVVLIDLNRQEYNNDHAETRRHTSLDGMDYEGAAFASAAETESEVLRREDRARLLYAIAALPDAQRELVLKVTFGNRSIASIAREEGVDESSIRERLRWAYKKLRKLLS